MTSVEGINKDHKQEIDMLDEIVVSHFHNLAIAMEVASNNIGLKNAVLISILIEKLATCAVYSELEFNESFIEDKIMHSFKNSLKAQRIRHIELKEKYENGTLFN